MNIQVNNSSPPGTEIIILLLTMSLSYSICSFDNILSFLPNPVADSFDVRGNFVESSLHKSDDVSEISSHSIRRKRSLHGNNNNEYTMEILVAVDRKMQEYHGEETRNYVLTLMSIVSGFIIIATDQCDDFE